MLIQFLMPEKNVNRCWSQLDQPLIEIFVHDVLESNLAFYCHHSRVAYGWLLDSWIMFFSTVDCMSLF